MSHYTSFLVRTALPTLANTSTFSFVLLQLASIKRAIRAVAEPLYIIIN